MKAVLMTSSILIVLIAALRPVLRGRIDPRVQYALWLAAALRLLIPVNFVDSAYSALALLERADRGQDIVETIGQTTVPIPGMSYEDAYDQALREYHQDRPATTSFTDLAEVERRAQEIQAKSPTLADLAAKYARPLWLGGAAMMGLWFLLVNLRLRRRLRWALPVEADCPLPVRVTPELPSPCLCGAVRPTIYITPTALENPDRLRHVLAHELTHCRHRDHWWALLRCLCLCLYWFNPLVWWAAALSRQDCELACDEGAIRRLGEAERLPYGRTLVDMIAAGRTPLLQTATTMTSGKRRVRERISLIARRPKTAAAAALALVVVLGLAVGCTFTGAPENPAGPEESQQPVESPPPEHALNAATADNLQKRLMDMPEELQADVLVRTIDQSETPSLASYWMNRDWTNLDNSGLGFLLRVYTLTPEEYEEEFVNQANYGAECFARSDGIYYIIASPTDARYYTNDDEQDYFNAYDAIRAFAMQTVLETEGVEPFTPAPTPAPWEADPTQFILDNLDAAFSNGTLAVRVFFNNGSGPASTAVEDSECGQKIRELFSAYDWEAAQKPQVESIPFVSFTVDFFDWDAPYAITINTYSDTLYMSPIDLSIGDDRPRFRADGAEKLSRDIAALCPDPRVQCAFVSCRAQETREGTARQFMDDLFAVMLENGHITSYELVRLDMLRENPDYPSMITFNVRFRLKAAHPEMDLWAGPSWNGGISVDESGWTNTIKWKIALHTDGESGIYLLDWIS